MEGYKVEQFVDKIDANFLCPICHDVLRDPVHCKDGHSFCRYCIEHWLRAVNRCPLDNSSIESKSLPPNLALRGIIENLKVYCHPQQTTENSESTAASVESEDTAQKCNWIDKLENLAKHQKTCPFQYVRCSHEKCIIKIQRRQIKEHEITCKYKIVVCDKCDVVLLLHEIEKHKQNDCPETLIPCSYECTDMEGLIQKVRRMDLDNHLANDCGKALVDCPFKDQGCLKQVERQGIDRHVQEDVEAHMKLVQNQNTKLKVELNEVKRKSYHRSFGSFLWKIYDYQSLAKNKTRGTSFASPMFLQCGHRWMLEMYPNGTNISGFGMAVMRLYWIGDEEGKQYENSKVSAVVRLETLSVKPGSKNHCVKRNILLTKTNDYWEWDRFMRSDVALSRTFCDSSAGILQIQCTIQLDDSD